MIYFLHRTLLIELGFCTANTRTKRMLRRRRSPDPPLLIPWITGRSPGLSRERWWWNRYVSEHRQELTTKGFKPVNFGLTKIPHPPPPQTDRQSERESSWSRIPSPPSTETACKFHHGRFCKVKWPIPGSQRSRIFEQYDRVPQRTDELITHD